MYEYECVKERERDRDRHREVIGVRLCVPHGMFVCLTERDRDCVGVHIKGTCESVC